MCGSPMDVLEVKNGSAEADNNDILFVLIDLYKSVLVNWISVPIYSFQFLSLSLAASLFLTHSAFSQHICNFSSNSMLIE